MRLPHRPFSLSASVLSLLILGAAGTAVSCDDDSPTAPRIEQLDPVLIAEGKEIFRHDTFGDEKYWTDTLRMHEVIQAAVTPAVALSVGLKVDAEALPRRVRVRWRDRR